MTTDTETTAQPLPDDALVIIPLRNTVLFPGVIAPLTVGRKESVAAAQTAAAGTGRVGFLLQRDASVDEPTPADLHAIGTTASVLRYVTDAEGVHHLVCNGESRFRVREFLSGFPFIAARIELLDEPAADDNELQARAMVLKQQATRAIELLPLVPPELAGAVQSVESPGALGDLVASFLDISATEKQEVLETVDVMSRLDLVIATMAQHLERIELANEIETKTRESIDERQREAILRQAGMPEAVEKHARKELSRLKRMPAQSGEHAMLRTYLDLLAELPWSAVDPEAIDIARARQVLDEDHYGLDKVKKRIIEFLAVRKLNPEGRSPILCFVGPSIARAIGLAFARISLGGVHDEAEIRGHRRTYIGALPGRIVQAINKAGKRNPVLMLDEIDKLGSGIHGDPSSALLEVLDPEQNSTFEDNYLGVPFDLSKVFFIATANRLDTVATPLLDRMEIIELSGYTTEEKLQIAKRYLVARQRKECGIAEDTVEITDAALERVIRSYTREAGCRALEKQIGALLRHVAVNIAEAGGDRPVIRIDKADVAEILGAPRFEDELALRTSLPGVATGLAWTPVGGDILFVESAMSPGSGRLMMTGQLGDVMKESGQAALSLLKSRAGTLGLDTQQFTSRDFHLHVPAGAIPKDGPSAGVAMFVALASLAAGRTVRHDVAMTGEISLRGEVLPIGGVKEKVIAARRAGIRTVLLPDRNRKDLEEIPETTRAALQFIWLKTVDDALQAALTPAGSDTVARTG